MKFKLNATPTFLLPSSHLTVKSVVQLTKVLLGFLQDS